MDELKKTLGAVADLTVFRKLSAYTFESKGRGKNNYQVFVVIHLLQG